MRYWLGVAAIVTGVSGPIVSHADSISRIGGPKETPPASFTGAQYVDSRGCVYMRAGYGGVVKWVPRIDDAHQVLCGYQPSMAGTMVATATAPAPQPMQAPVQPTRVAAAPAPMMVAAPVMVAAPPQPAMAPVADTSTVTIPRGYVLAWQDDRLNPLRGRGNAEGQAAMERVWTKTVPMKLLPTQGVAVQPSSIVDAAYQVPVVHMAASNTAAAPVVSGRYVQVGSFAVAANAAGAANRLRSLGLPVAMAAGRGAQVVLAGPFTDPSALSAALQAARGAGFGDAFARN